MDNFIQLIREVIDVNNLLLDPNNPRFFDLEGWTSVNDNIFHLDSIQNAAFQRLENTHIGQIQELRKSIEANGYIPTELIVVKRYPYLDSKFIVIEGNRRLVSIKSIIRDSLDPDNDSLVKSLSYMEVLMYQSTGDVTQDKINEMILQGIRHISGPKEWGAYQKANLVVSLHDDLNINWPEIGRRLALGPRITARYYKAFKALKQMMEDEEFGEYATTTLFSLFDEAVKSPSIRDWLNWSDQDVMFNDKDKTKLHAFYNLLVGEPDGQRSPQINNPQDMRDFGEIISSSDTVVIHRFLEGALGIKDSLQLIKPEPVHVSLKDSLNAFLDALSSFPAERVGDLSDEFELFNQVIEKLNRLRKLHEAFEKLSDNNE